MLNTYPTSPETKWRINDPLRAYPSLHHSSMKVIIMLNTDAQAALHTTLNEEMADQVSDALNTAAAAANKKIRRAKLRKRLYYIAGGAVLIGAAAAAVYIFVPGLRGVVAATAETTSATVAEVSGEVISEAVG